MRILLATLSLILLTSCATVGKDQAKVVFELQEAAEISYRQGKFEDALAQYQQLVKHLPLSLHAWLRLAIAMRALALMTRRSVPIRPRSLLTIPMPMHGLTWPMSSPRYCHRLWRTCTNMSRPLIRKRSAFTS